MKNISIFRYTAKHENIYNLNRSCAFQLQNIATVFAWNTWNSESKAIQNAHYGLLFYRFRT